jgi:hypothetical protein
LQIDCCLQSAPCESPAFLMSDAAKRHIPAQWIVPPEGKGPFDQLRSRTPLEAANCDLQATVLKNPT